MIYPRPEVIQRLHEKIIASTGGSAGLREPGMLVAICEKPQATYGGEDLYPTIADKAAALYEALINYHVFVDGNKRTAVISLNYFLSINGYELTANDAELERYTLQIATHNPKLTDIAKWIAQHSKQLDSK